MRFERREVGFLDGVMIFLFVIAANIAVQLIMGIIFGLAGNLSESASNYMQLIAMIVFQFVFAAVPVIYYSAKKVRPVLAFPVNKPRISLTLSVLLPVISVTAFMLPALLFETLLLSIGYKPSGLEFHGAGHTVLAVIATAVLAPVAEELIFRGFLLGGLKKEFGTYTAALLSALAFSLMHMNPEQTVYQFCLGYVCALAAIKSGTLLAPVIVHSGSNLLALFADPLISEFARIMTANAAVTALGTVGFFIAGAAAVFGICKAMEVINRKREKSAVEPQPQEQIGEERAETKSKNRKTGIMIYIGGLGICAAMWIFVFASAML